MALLPGSDLWNYFNNLKEEGIAECKLCKARLRNNRSHNLKLHINRVHTNREAIDKYFEINIVENIAACRTCKQRLKNRLCNIRLHMRRAHNIELKLPEEKLIQTWTPPKPYDEDKIQAVLKVAKRKMAEQVAKNGKRPTHRLFIKMEKKTVIRSVIGLVIEDGITPRIFQSKHFDAILNPIYESISDKEVKEFKLNETEIERIINLMANNIRNDFSNDLDSRLLSIKIDTDLDALSNTFCVTAMFVSDGEIQKRILGLIDLESDIKLQEDHIKQILHKFNIDSNQIVSVFWDNTKSKYKMPVHNSEYLNNVERFSLYPEIFLGDVKIEPYLGSLAQKCLLNIFRNPKILQPFLECRNLVKFISEERNGYLELFKLNNISPPQLDSPWAAGSTCKMMNILLEARNFLQPFKLENPEEAVDQFNSNEDLWFFIEAFCKSTNYLQKTIIKYYNEELHIGDFYAQWLKCKLMTEKLSANNTSPNKFLSTILADILESIESITNDLLKNYRITACLHLDPRFQHILSVDQKKIAVEYLKNLWYRSKLYRDDDVVPNETANQLFDDDEDAYLNEFLSNGLQVKDKESDIIFQKIERLILPFQAADTNILSFWRGIKASDAEVFTLSTICFAIPATEIYIKTRYAHIYRLNDKSDLSAFTNENILSMRLNAHLLDESLSNLHLTKDEQSDYSLNSSDSEEDSFGTSEDGNSNAASSSTAVSPFVPKSTYANVYEKQFN